MNKENKITGIILAGGKSSRMGQDKGLMLLNGKGMIQYVVDALKPVVDEIMIVANNDEYRKFGYKVHPDLMPNLGPLSGIYTGLTHSTTQKNVVLSCDLPLITTRLIQKIINHSPDKFDAEIVKCGENVHPLTGIYNKSLTTFLMKELKCGNLKVRDALKRVKTNYIEVSEEFANELINVNTKQELNNLPTI